MKVLRRRWPTLLLVVLAVSLLAVLSQAVVAKPQKGDPSLRGSWSFDEGSGTVAKDNSAYKNHGSITGATWTAGKNGTALHFDGVGDRVVVPRSAALEPENVSLALWFRAERPAGDAWRFKVLAEKGVINCQAASYSLKSDGSGTGLIFMLYDATNKTHPATPAATGVWDGEWHHAVGTFDGSVLRLYVDGVLQGKTDWRGDIPYGLRDHNDLVIGNAVTTCQPGGVQYIGDLDELHVWDRALSAKEVARLANPTTGKKPKH